MQLLFYSQHFIVSFLSSLYMKIVGLLVNYAILISAVIYGMR
jgi:hypothetical protein